MQKSEKYAHGDSYDREYLNGDRHGKGQYQLANGNQYYGDWKNDKRTGGGKFQYVSGESYDGEYLNGEKHGKGEYKWASGSIFMEIGKMRKELDGINKNEIGQMVTDMYGGILICQR
ncbi:unnamed protein product [Paramecium octaurelia]|uniref:Uncharacterized protein n=1 Tax=Paramecium octaurelia TaxID=43137 RepID=A0A8S1X9L9_PAROT|nr:unnamed protein product [Paramecium octaurelia]